MTVNVLGTKYKIITDSNDNSLMGHGADGVCRIYSKEIRTLKKEDMISADDGGEIERDRRYKEVLRHEILHAFFHESGMDDEDDEQLVYWLARIFPKIVKAFQSVDCLGVEE